jgi:hypothetical protein
VAGRQRPYLSYLLRLWMVEGDGPVWRASLENPSTAERHGFSSLEKLVGFLAERTCELASEEGWELEVGGPAGPPRREPVGG